MKNYSPKILITGSDGQVGHALCAHKLSCDFSIIACNREKMDITQYSSIQRAITQYSPDIIINTAAYTAVDKAETEPDQAMLINHHGAENLAIACHENNIPLIHLSTDYIFDGKNTSPYREDDTPNPINVYGKTKLLGEEAVRQSCDQHIILRVSGVFSEYGNNFMKTILRLANERKELNIVSDQITCPTNANNIAGVIYTMIKTLKSSGTWHYCDTPPLSWYEFACDIISAAKKDVRVNAITTADYPLPAKRPAFSVLDCSKLEKDYGIAQKHR